VSQTISIQEKTTCYHCGEDVLQNNFQIEEKHFCCKGCQTVYEILHDKQLCNYYTLVNQPGLNQKQEIRKGKFDLLSDPSIADGFIYFKQDHIHHATFYLPQIHCHSCIWILENLHKINKDILNSSVNFIKKEVSIQFNANNIGLQSVAETLAKIGYEPHISLSHPNKKEAKRTSKEQVLKIGIAGFCFGNIMMLSFPDYFSSGVYEDFDFNRWFNYLNLFFSLPVFFYCASDFFFSAVKSIQQKILNIDAPIALAIFITFSRSAYEILNQSGTGYLDSMSGIVFFMLIGRYFQNRVYQSIAFDRDFTSYFPLGVTLIKADKTEMPCAIANLKIGDRIKIFDHEIIPADALLLRGEAVIDYSFVTGESHPIKKELGEIIYAGGKQIAGAVELEIVKEVAQSYLTKLWNNSVFKEKNTKNENASFIHVISKYFSFALFTIALISASYWQINDPSKTWLVFTSVLIVACPCALLLSATFTNGNLIKHLNEFQCYVKNDAVLECMAKINTIVFDKTGTITQQQMQQVVFQGTILSAEQEQFVKTLVSQSNHPLSKSIANTFSIYSLLPFTNFRNENGLGISATIHGQAIQMGSADYILNTKHPKQQNNSCVYLAINHIYLGFFSIKNEYRRHLNSVIKVLQSNYKLKIVSGDTDIERAYLKNIFGENIDMHFNQNPESKLHIIKKIQSKNNYVAMIGDGLNDAGALKQSDVGIAISDNTNNFSPACDIILAGEKFHLIPHIIHFCKKQKTIIYACFILSILYNGLGLYFAVKGELKPVIAAILMPLSSISIVLLTTLLSAFFAFKIKQSDTYHSKT
jgi:P-type Cu+ transporter